MKTRHIKQQLNCELPEIDPPPPPGAVEYSPAVSKPAISPQAKEAARLREEGLSVIEVAKRLGICKSRAALLTRIGNPSLAQKRSPKTNSRRKAIAEMASAGCTHKEIGEELGISRQSVTAHIAELRADQQREKTQ